MRLRFLVKDRHHPILAPRCVVGRVERVERFECHSRIQSVLWQSMESFNLSKSLADSSVDATLVFQVRQRPKYRIQHMIQLDAHILNQKTKHEVTVFLQ